jgi:hypothetical protein
VQRLRILIHGQETETLAGHLDLTGTFVVNTKPAQAPGKPPLAPPTPGAAIPGSNAPAADKPPVAAAKDRR